MDCPVTLRTFMAGLLGVVPNVASLMIETRKRFESLMVVYLL